MKTYFSSEQIDAQYPRDTVVAIGNFDGVHVGHQAILGRAKTLGKQLNLPVTVLTFNPHPTIELRPQAPLKLLMTYGEKRAQLEKLHIEFCVEQPFDHVFAMTSAKDFFFEILKNRLHAQGIVVGQDFAFGHKREGSLETLKAYCLQSKTQLEVVDPVLIENQPVSSSRIREALAGAELDLAERLLGHPFFYRGEVIHGDKRGRLLGFPTANMKCEEKFPLLPGVYATSVFWQNRVYPSVTNIGKSPTFHQNENLALIPLRIETHLLHQNLELYGEVLEVRFHLRLREEKKFASVEELKKQIQVDSDLAESFFNSKKASV